MESDETVSLVPTGEGVLPDAPGPAKGAEAPAFPIPGWDRYQHLGFLGQGGMGRVFLAYDPRLRRQVALKFIRDDHPELTLRFLSEARAQAKVNHERVCKVYEVGQVGQTFFIAMQYVEGWPLSALAQKLTLEQKARVLREVALGVHEAHRVGLIHRDLKPSNIMVERAEDGVPRPYVMDFGLARDWKEGMTVTGTVMGTPHYMAPEQARGEVARLDCRADVYSLGATLYDLLTGQPPIQGSNGLEVLSNLATVEPRPPRALDRSIPPDLEAITLKCLEKEPSARYDSARALAEDLDRFLSGEPVLARTGPGYRLLKRLRKHRLVFTAATAALLALALALGWGIRARREATERARLARHFSTLVERIESRARYSALSRLHDTRKDREAIQALHSQMEEMETEIRQGGEWALGPGHYALGRGALVLGDTTKARRHLELAWQHGFRLPKAAYALGLVLGQLYQQQLLEVEKIRDDTERRESLLRDLERRYRDPALGYLRQSHGAEDPSAEYIEALIAFYEGRLDDALAQLDTVSAKEPWFYEAPKLRGDIFVVRFYKRWREENVEGAKADLEAGRKAYAAAATIAESVPAVHLGLAQLEAAEMSYTNDGVMSSYTRSHEALNQCLAVAPDDYLCWVALARLHHRLSFSKSVSDVEQVLAKAIEAAERALALVPTRREARMRLAESISRLAYYRWSYGEDPREKLRRAADFLEGIPPEDRDIEFHYLSASIWFVWAGSTQEASGQASLEPWNKQIQALEAILAIDDRVSRAWKSLGSVYLGRASYQPLPESEQDLAQSMLAYDKARSLTPQDIDTYWIASASYTLQARKLRNRGGDPMPYLARALEWQRKGLAINPRWHSLYQLMGMTLQEQARETWFRSGNPFPLLDQARAAFEQALSVAPADSSTYHQLGMLFAQRARYLRSRGEDPGPSIREAEEIAKHGRGRMKPGDADFWLILGSVHFTRSGFNVDRGHAPGPDLARAEEELRHALGQKLNETGFTGSLNRAEAWFRLGEVQSLRARWQARSGKARAEEFEEAAKSYEKAIEMEPIELEYPLRLGFHCAAWANWQKQSGVEHDRVLKRGSELADKILKVRPDWVEALALRARLLSE